MRFITFLSLLTVLLLMAGGAGAQAFEHLRVAPELVLRLEGGSPLVGAAPLMAAPPPSAEAARAELEAAKRERARLRRSRVLVAAGVGALLGGLGGVIVGVRGHQCYHDESRRVNKGWTAGGAAFGGIGMGLSVAGLVGILRHDDRRSRVQRWLIPVGIGGALVSTAVGWVAGLPEWIGCVSS